MKFFYNIVFWLILCTTLSNSAFAEGGIIDSKFNINYQSIDSLLERLEANQLDLNQEQTFQFLVISSYRYYFEFRSPLPIDGENVKSLSQNEKYVIQFLKKLHTKKQVKELELERLKEIHRKRENISIEATTALIIAEVYQQLNNAEKALKYFKRANNRSRFSSFKTVGILSNLLQSRYYYEMKLYERAFTFAQKSLNISQTENNDYWLIQSYLALGKIQLALQNFDMAYHFLNEIVQFNSEMQHPLLSAMIEKCLGQYYSEKRDFKKSKELYNNALIKFHKHKKDEFIGRLHILLAEDFIKQRDFVLAEENFNLSLLYLKKDTTLLANANFGLGKVYLENSQPKKAIKKFENTEKLLTIDEKNSFNFYYYKAEAYNEANNQEKSIQYFKKYIQLKDSIRTDDLSKKIAELNSLFQNERNERKILEQQKSLNEKEDKILINSQKLENERLRNRQLFLLIIFIILFFGVIMSLVLVRNKQVKLQQKSKASELKQAVLRLQMNPHFIFNSFTVIQSYIYEKDQKTSSKFLVNFSRLLRLILEKSNEEKISIRDEIEILNKYLDVQKMRFRDRFKYSIELDDELKSISDILMIPPLISQPFVENAIEHGQLELSKNGLIQIKFSKLNAQEMEIVIQDNGIGIESGYKSTKQNKKHKSLALKITKERIDLINTKSKTKADLQIFDLKEINQNGTRVVIKIPIELKTR